MSEIKPNRVPRFIFLDAQEQAKKRPDDFYAPSERELSELKAGDIVKVAACRPDGSDGERFWVKITKTYASSRHTVMVAKVENNLLYSEVFGFDFGDEVVIEPRHIYDIYEKCLPENSR